MRRPILKMFRANISWLGYNVTEKRNVDDK